MHAHDVCTNCLMFAWCLLHRVNGLLHRQATWCDCGTCREQLLMAMADVMAAEGYLNAGYQYVTVDDCWLANSRDENGRLQPDPARFPRGMKHLADYVRTIGSYSALSLIQNHWTYVSHSYNHFHDWCGFVVACKMEYLWCFSPCALCTIIIVCNTLLQVQHVWIFRLQRV